MYVYVFSSAYRLASAHLPRRRACRLACRKEQLSDSELGCDGQKIGASLLAQGPRQNGGRLPNRFAGTIVIGLATRMCCLIFRCITRIRQGSGDLSKARSRVAVSPLSQVVCRYREDREGTDGTSNHEGEDLAQWRTTIVDFSGLPKDGIDQWSDPFVQGARLCSQYQTTMSQMTDSENPGMQINIVQVSIDQECVCEGDNCMYILGKPYAAQARNESPSSVPRSKSHRR